MISLLEFHKIKKSQKDLDFVVPFLDLDRRYFLDPSLLRFSKTPLLKSWNEELSSFLKLVHQVLRQRNADKLRKLLNIGEAQDAGLGYCEEGVSGSGFGKEISGNVIKILNKNPEFIKRGFLRLEELQWFDSLIGPDRISDLTIHILKRNIIQYTQKQAKLHKIPVEKVRIGKVFYPDSLEWGSMVVELPVNPLRHSRDSMNEHPPQLLLPKEALKLLPLFLNYQDFYGFVDRTPTGRRKDPDKKKKEIVEYALKHPKESARYIRSKEKNNQDLYRPNFDEKVLNSLERLDYIKTGRAQANEYRALIAELLGYVFPDLELYKQEKSTLLKDKQRDIIFVNNGKSGVFATFNVKHGAAHIVVDAKNTKHITPKDISRVADYLDNDIGRVAFIVSRKKADNRLYRHANTQLTKQNKVIIFISDEDIKKWIRGTAKIQHITGKEQPTVDPVKAVQNQYSALVSS